MALVRINDVVENFGVSSRTLRYYEETGLLWSARPDNKPQRYYDAAALERLKQLIVLRKLQIPIKDIAKIYKSESMAALIQAFVTKLEALDKEISALSELRKLVDDFLHKMLLGGVKKISAITLLYEETEKRLVSAKTDDAVTFERLSAVSREATTLRVRIIDLPPMRVLTSRRKTGEAENLDAGKMQNLFTPYGFTPAPGMRDCFMRREPGDEWVMLIKIPNEYENATAYLDEALPGGLYAVADTFFESLEDTFALLREWVNGNEDFALDEERPEMLEEILPWEIVRKLNRFQQDIFIPIKIKTPEGKDEY